MIAHGSQLAPHFFMAAPSLEHVQFFFIFLLPPKHGLLAGLGLFISVMDTKGKSLAHFTSISHVSMHREGFLL